MRKPQFLIASPASHSGKTTVTLALLSLFHEMGYRVQPYKCGPDYLDPIHHTRAAKRHSINLDSFLATPQHLDTIYHHYLQQADIAIVEGVMGLFDGADKMQGSSAEIAILLQLPVILIVNAKAMAFSAAPLLYGFKQFDQRLNLVGVIFNHVNQASHYQRLQEACETVGLTSLGYLPTNEAIQIPSRYLGLSIEENDEHTLQAAAQHVKAHIDLEKLVAITTQPCKKSTSRVKTKHAKKQKIIVAQDAAFNFFYAENLKKLAEYGEIIFFSPLKDKRLPKGDFLYLAGGYPELYLESLSQNVSVKNDISEFCQQGNRVYAECGGMMYLAKTIYNKANQPFVMVDFLNLTIKMDKLHLGYRKVKFSHYEARGHEFHYSTETTRNENTLAVEVTDARDCPVSTHIYKKQNTIASYIHIYWGDNNVFLNQLLHESMESMQ